MKTKVVQSVDKITQEIKDEKNQYRDTFLTDLIYALPYRVASTIVPSLNMADYEQTTDPEMEIRDYMSFAWDKANDCRSLSASRSIEHMSAWLFLLGKEELVTRINEEYAFYGKTSLYLICKEFDINWKSHDDNEWKNSQYEDALTAEEALKEKGLIE